MTLIVIDRLTITSDCHAQDENGNTVQAPEKIYHIPLAPSMDPHVEALKHAVAFAGHHGIFSEFFQELTSKHAFMGKVTHMTLKVIEKELHTWAIGKSLLRDQKEYETFSLYFNGEAGVTVMTVNSPNWDFSTQFYEWDENTTTMAFGGAAVGPVRSSLPWFGRVIESHEKGLLPDTDVTRWYFQGEDVSEVERTRVKLPSEQKSRKGGARLKRYSAKFFNRKANA